MASMTIKRNDTSPSFTATCTDAAGDPVDITSATVRFHMVGPVPGTEVKVDAAATVVSGAAGTVRYDWQTGDTDTHGSYKAEVEVTLSDGTIRTFPTSNYSIVRIVSDLA